MTHCRIDMTADEQARRETDSVRTDQIGKVFIVIGQDVRKCLICEQLFTRRAASKHAKVDCHWILSAKLLRML